MLEELDLLQKVAVTESETVYSTLESLCICFPGRVSGSEVLEKSLDFLSSYGRDCLPASSCSEEPVTCVPCWNRGDWRTETCVVSIHPSAAAKPEPFPLERNIRILANGLSIGTGPEGVTGDIYIVHTWDALHDAGAKGLLHGKIVLYDYVHFITYGDHNSFRNKGANEAAKYGAIAVLIRSLAPDSTASGAHTGVQQEYAVENGVVLAIPAACVAVEDVEMLTRLAKRGHSLSACLTLPCYFLPDRTSRNLVFELKGSDLPEEVVIIGGHTDCWDCQHGCCQGAHDDGQGVVISLEIIRILHKLDFKPRRTIRAVLFVDEEVRQSGANAYAEAHSSEAPNIVAAIETDLGVGPVCGFGFTGSSGARQILRELLEPLGVLGNVNRVDDRWSGKGVDISPLIEKYSVPGLLLRHEDTWWNGEYFHMHHSTADTIDHVDKNLLVLNMQVLLCTVWLLANSDITLNSL